MKLIQIMSDYKHLFSKSQIVPLKPQTGLKPKEIWIGLLYAEREEGDNHIFTTSKLVTS